MRWSLLFLLLALLGCDKPTKPQIGSFSAEASEAVNLKLAGGAHFWCVKQPLKVCGIHLTPTGQDGDSINFTITGSKSMDATRPAVGTYPLSPDVDPSGSSMRANYMAGAKGDHHHFVAKKGELTISESTSGYLKGSFTMEAYDIDQKRGQWPRAKVTGTFTSPCKPEMRKAFTCD